MGWAFNPNLSLRFPIMFPYVYNTRTGNDFFIAGDSGAGYVNPTQLLVPRNSSLPSAEFGSITVNFFIINSILHLQGS